jgi:hypothetical protein
VNWVDKPVAAGDEKSAAGLTAGSSFQDYRIASVGIPSRATLATATENDSDASKTTMY